MGASRPSSEGLHHLRLPNVVQALVGRRCLGKDLLAGRAGHLVRLASHAAHALTAILPVRLRRLFLGTLAGIFLDLLLSLLRLRHFRESWREARVGITISATGRTSLPTCYSLFAVRVAS